MYPWEYKEEKAFMRASIYGVMPVNCTRAVLALATKEYPDK
jgi:hypothetical protein